MKFWRRRSRERMGIVVPVECGYCGDMLASVEGGHFTVGGGVALKYPRSNERPPIIGAYSAGVRYRDRRGYLRHECGDPDFDPNGRRQFDMHIDFADRDTVLAWEDGEPVYWSRDPS